MEKRIEMDVVIASVLKPVDDTRMTEKIACSVANIPLIKVTVIGFPGSGSSTTVKSIELPRFNRLSFRRLLIPWRVMEHLLRIRPALVIITTHELLVIAALSKLFTGCRVIYDVQENYYLNIRYTSAFPPIIRTAIASFVRAKEFILAKWIDRFWLAERCYAKELDFVRERHTVVENKVRRPVTVSSGLRNRRQLIFTGTLAESTGVYIAVDLAKKLHEVNKDINLTIIGFCAKQSEWFRLRDAVHGCEFITIIGGDRLVPHSRILDFIATAGAGIIAYPPNPSTAGSIPTKLYEYLGYCLPILMLKNPKLEEIAVAAGGQVSVFHSLSADADTILQFLDRQVDIVNPPSELYWDSVEPNIVLDLSTLLNRPK